MVNQGPVGVTGRAEADMVTRSATEGSTESESRVGPVPLIELSLGGGVHIRVIKGKLVNQHKS